MLSDLLHYIDRLNINKGSDSILVAVSGGVDSMVLLDVLKRASLQIGVAHINHNLRGTESDLDHDLVAQYCNEHSIPFYHKKVDASIWETGNMQSKAREIRYAFFRSISDEKGYSYIATAHHSGDSIETVLLNFAKSTGLKGMTGIPSVNDDIIRPLSGIEKKEILAYANEYSVPFRKDASNNSLKYDRNLIRHQVIPVLTQIAPQFNTTAYRTIENLKDTELLLDHFTAKWKKEHCSENNEILTIPNEAFASLPGKQSLLFSILKPYGFNDDQVRDIINTIGNSGKHFSSYSSILYVEREYLKLFKQRKQIDTNKDNDPSDLSAMISIEEVKEIEHNSDPYVEFINGDLLNLENGTPFAVRQIQNGDRIQPLGMNGQSKLVSDILTDIKMDHHQKQNTLIMHLNEQPIWLVGIRLDHRFRVTEKTKKTFKITAKTK